MAPNQETGKHAKNAETNLTMQLNPTLFIFAFGLAVVPSALLMLYIGWQGALRGKHHRPPIDDLPRRPAGEALRLKLETLDEKISIELLCLNLFPAMMAISWLGQSSHGWRTGLFFLGLTFGASAFFGGRLLRTFRTRANYRLGYEGERFVGEALNRLLNQGFEVYHDVPFDDFNIDHVLVGTRGVFIVETKTRRMPLSAAGTKQSKVQFDGQRLLWPRGKDCCGIEQSLRNAKTLALWLGSACGEKCWVTPILTLPGWMVERLVPHDRLHVVNPKEIRKLCLSFPEKLSEAQLTRIRHQLDQKCRLVLD
jgi:hypothetical protein